MKKVLLPILLIIIPQILFSQMSKKEQSEMLTKNVKEIRMQEHIGTPFYMSFRDGSNLTHEQAIEYSKGLCAQEDVGFILKNEHSAKDGKQLYRYVQTIAGYPVEFSAWHVHEKNGKVTALNGDIVDTDGFEAIFTLSEEEALQIALNHIGAAIYMWMEEGEEQNIKMMLEDETATYYPSGVKIITPTQPDIKKNKLTTAYKFNIYSLQPFDRKMVYVDAQTGEILFDLPLIHHDNRVEGIAHTQYSGIQPIQTTQQGAQYILQDLTRGNGIKTYNLQKGTNYGSAANFFDDDNIWNNVNAQKDEYATDAHFATISTYDYFFNVHNRNSINGNGYNLLSYVHYSNNYVNAFWDGQRMTYGDGNLSGNPPTTPLTTIDICGHEVSHGLTEFTAGLVYAKEPGGLNEGFSDIFGTAIEFYAVPEYANWTMGEKMGWIIRSMSNPKAYGQPNTYGGSYWVNQVGCSPTQSNDYCGVHTNSGVLNYWFYLISEGGSGVNDKGYSYQVQGIGIENAEQIAFKTLVEYLTPNSQFIDACNYAIIVAGELFGGCTPEVQAVGDAFYAVGVLTQPFESVATANFKAAESIFCSVPAQVAFINKSMNGISYLWDFGDGTTSTETNPVHTYANTGNYTVTLSVDGGECGNDVITKEQYIKIDPSYLCNIKMPTNSTPLNVEGCAGVFYSPGWPNNYPNNLSSSVLTIRAPGATGIVLTIEEFDIEPGSGSTCNYDYVCFHDGNSTSAPKINNTNYCNTTGNPGTIESTGEYITIRFYSDAMVNHSGFKIIFHCLGMPTVPNANFSANITTSCIGNIQFIDNSTNQPTEWLWDFGDGDTGTEQNPAHQYTQSGTYTVSLTATNEHGSNTNQKEDFITITIPETPEIEDILGCNDDEFEIILDLEGTAYWYENITDEEPVYIGNTWNHAPIEEDITYFLREVFEFPGNAEEFCMSNFAEVLIISEICLSIHQNQLENIMILPNPSNGLFYLKGLTEGIDYKYVVVDISGKMIIDDQPLVSELIDLSSYSNGIYFIRISTSENVRTFKLVNMK